MLATTPRLPSLALQHSLRRAARRAWWRRATGLAAGGLAVANGIGASAALCAGPAWGAWSWVALAAGGFCVAGIRLRRECWTPRAAARAFDRQLGLEDRVASALDLAEHPWGGALLRDAEDQLARHPGHELVARPRLRAAILSAAVFALAAWASQPGPDLPNAASAESPERSRGIIVVAVEAGAGGAAPAPDVVSAEAPGSTGAAAPTPPAAPNREGEGPPPSSTAPPGPTDAPPPPSHPPAPTPRPDPSSPQEDEGDAPIERGPSEEHPVQRRDQLVTPLFGEGRHRFELGQATVPRTGHGESTRPKSWAQLHHEYERLARDHLERPGLSEAERDLVRRYLDLVRPSASDRR